MSRYEMRLHQIKIKMQIIKGECNNDLFIHLSWVTQKLNLPCFLLPFLFYFFFFDKNCN